MTSIIALHSHKGGNGKTIVSINLATMLVEMGMNVAVIDLDLSAPSLQTYAPNRTEKKINDLLFKTATIEEVIFDATYLLGENMSGTMYMGLADVHGTSISKLGQRGKDALLDDLYILTRLVKNELPNDPWNVDYIIIDTSPGLSTTSINGVAIADYLVVLLKLTNGDLEGTYYFLDTIHRVLQPKTYLVVNQVPSNFIEDDGIDKTKGLLEKKLIKKINGGKIQFLGLIEFDPDIIERELAFAFANADQEEPMPRPIHFLVDANGKFSKSLHSAQKDLLFKEE